MVFINLATSIENQANKGSELVASATSVYSFSFHWMKFRELGWVIVILKRYQKGYTYVKECSIKTFEEIQWVHR